MGVFSVTYDSCCVSDACRQYFMTVIYCARSHQSQIKTFVAYSRGRTLANSEIANYILDARQSPTVAHPTIPLAACRRSLLIGQLLGLPASSTSVALLLVRRPPSAECDANPILWIEADKTKQHWLPRQYPLRDRKTNFKSFVYSQSFPTTSAKIGPVDVEIVGLTEIANK